MAERKHFLTEAERRILGGVQVISDGNPFLPERVEAEQAVLGAEFVSTGVVWHVDAELEESSPNLVPLATRVKALADTLRERLSGGAKASEAELAGYESLIRYLLFAQHEDDLLGLILGEERGESSTRPMPEFDRCRELVDHYLRIPRVRFPMEIDAGRLFAWGYQIRRAFHHTHRQIFGGSMPTARLRADVWQSIFTCNVPRYRRSLQERMGDIPTLILGESGTGKELVARAVGLSRYIPFDAKRRCFTAESRPLFHPVNLSALPTSLIESELFGHRRGAFTGAVTDRVGWLETCLGLGTIFLDEIGELEPEVQVKLLRVLQERRFQRVGETEERRFDGKIIAATHRNLQEAMVEGTFRQDLYYRICADVIRTPPLREQIADAPDELRNLVLVIARRVIGHDDAETLCDEVVTWIGENLGPEYPWPGNIRELEQCLRNIMIHGEYQPSLFDEAAGGGDAKHVFDRGLKADELLNLYCVKVYGEAGSYEEAARRLGLDRRTVKSRVDAG